MLNTDAAIAANFERIILILDCQGPAYEPQAKNLELSALEEKLEEACAVFCDFDDASRDQLTKLKDFEASINDFPFADALVEARKQEAFDAAWVSGADDATSKIISKLIESKDTALTGIELGRETVGPDARIRALEEYGKLIHYIDTVFDRSGMVNHLQLIKFRRDALRAAEAGLGGAARARERVLGELPKIVDGITKELARQPGRESAPYHQVKVLAQRKF